MLVLPVVSLKRDSRSHGRVTVAAGVRLRVQPLPLAVFWLPVG